ncbi:MAG TPA: ABC transporter permease [Bryobacteraceae bacterium]
MVNDILFAFRTLRRSPGFTAVAILSLALGIGANTAIFSLLYQVVLRSLPVRDPQSLVVLRDDSFSFGWNRRDSDCSVFSYPMYEALRDRNQVFDGLIGRAAFSANFSYNANAVSANAELVTGNFFDVLGVKPALGRLVLPSDDHSDAQEIVVVLSYRFWSHQLGQNPAVLNHRVLVNRHPMLVVGIAPPGFHGVISGRDPDLYAPINAVGLFDPNWTTRALPDHYWIALFGRLKPEISEQQANAKLLPLFRSTLREELPQFKNASASDRQRILAKTLAVQPAAQGFNQLQLRWETPLLVLMVMVGMVLLMACVNVANLLMARAAGREREFAIRLAVGATKFQVFRQLLIESLVLSFAGGLFGLLLSGALTAGLLHLIPPDVLGSWLTAQINWSLLGFSFALAVVTGVLFGLAPALQAVRPELAHTLREKTSGISASSSQGRFRQSLVAAQVCFSLLLLIGAGLFTRSLVNLMNNDPGFQPDGLVTFSIEPTLAGYTSSQNSALRRQLGERLGSIPGVRSVARANLIPLGGNNIGNGISKPGVPFDREHILDVRENLVGPGYFHTLGIPLLAGRDFSDADTSSSQRVVILSEAVARRLFPGESPIGHQLRMGAEGTTVQVVGLVRDSKFEGLRDAPGKMVYVPDEQSDFAIALPTAFFLRTADNDRNVMTAVPKAVKQLDASLPVNGLTTMKDFVDNTIYTDRLMAILAIAFGVLATTLAAVGLYGIISYAVTRRTQEFGIRLALGAERRDIVRLVIREVAWLVGIGLVVGLPASYALARLIESQLYGIQAYDPFVLLGAVLVLAIAAALSGWIPTLRAMRIEPTQALRYE